MLRNTLKGQRVDASNLSLATLLAWVLGRLLAPLGEPAAAPLHCRCVGAVTAADFMHEQPCRTMSAGRLVPDLD